MTHIRRRRLLWFNILTVAFCGILIPLRLTLGHLEDDERNNYQLSLENAAIWFTWGQAPGGFFPYYPYEYHQGLRIADRWTPVPVPWFVSESGWHQLVFPLWPIPLIGFILFAWAHRRRADAASCKACGYSMAGNTTGRCPECGLPRG